MKTITLDLIRSFGPCYDPSKYVSNPKWKGDVVKVLNNPSVPAADKIWLVVRSEFMSDKLLHTFACDVVESFLEIRKSQGRKVDERSLKAIWVKRLWLEGKATDQELRSARELAWQAYYADAAAATAAYADAAAAAAAAAATAAYADAAARKAERERQVRILKNLIKTMPNELK